MFTAIILPRQHEQLTQSIEEKIIFYPATSDYLLCSSNEATVPLSIKEQLRPVIIDTGFVSPVRAFQHFEYLIEDLRPNIYRRSAQGPQLEDQFVSNRQLLALRSKLAYACAELLAPTQFYFKLETPVNSTGTQRLYQYHLYYNELQCYVLDTSLLEAIDNYTDAPLGPLICSTRSLTMVKDDPPRWYIRETLRDLCELGEIDMKDKELIEGSATGQLYLFYKEEVNLTQDQQTDLIDEIRGSIASSIQARIFPRGTPDRFIKSRQLVQMTNRQWTLPVIWLPQDPQLFNDILETSFSFRNADDLFWFLLWLSLSPTYSFIERELEIFVRESTIQVRYRTEYYLDYLRVTTARRVQHKWASSGQGEILYPGRLDQELTSVLGERPFIHFYDQERNDRAVVALEEGDLYLPTIERTAPIDFSLDSRIKRDVDLSNLI